LTETHWFPSEIDPLQGPCTPSLPNDPGQLLRRFQSSSLTFTLHSLPPHTSLHTLVALSTSAHNRLILSPALTSSPPPPLRPYGSTELLAIIRFSPTSHQYLLIQRILLAYGLANDLSVRPPAQSDQLDFGILPVQWRSFNERKCGDGGCSYELGKGESMSSILIPMPVWAKRERKAEEKAQGRVRE
jgi:hypothetical protein